MKGQIEHITRVECGSRSCNLEVRLECPLTTPEFARVLEKRNWQFLDGEWFCPGDVDNWRPRRKEIPDAVDKR